MGHRDLACAQQVGELQYVGSPVLLPLERGKHLGADPISEGAEQTGFQVCLPPCCFTSILPALLGSLSSILSTLVSEKLQARRNI